MSRSADRTVRLALVALAWLVAMPAPALSGPRSNGEVGRFGFGKPASAAEIAGWDIDVRPDGTGLPAGRGSVSSGQRLYDDKCASCHGTFGESNDYMALAGGVGTLASGQPIRTTGSKLNHATTLFDYINRAMPFGNPKTLSADEVYALTAYVLHLNDILPADAVLDRASILAVRMPNRDGFTTDHGMKSRAGRPDTSNVACMRDCAKDVRVVSQLPEHARDSHGNLAEQTRAFGPVAGVPTIGTVGPSAVAAAKPDPAELARQSSCMACHAVASKIVGPAFKDVAVKYGRDAAAEAKLVGKVTQGSVGTWGSVPMPPQAVGEEEARAIVAWILGGAR
jgi:cytochrome c